MVASGGNTGLANAYAAAQPGAGTVGCELPEQLDGVDTGLVAVGGEGERVVVILCGANTDPASL